MDRMKDGILIAGFIGLIWLITSMKWDFNITDTAISRCVKYFESLKDGIEGNVHDPFGSVPGWTVVKNFKNTSFLAKKIISNTKARGITITSFIRKRGDVADSSPKSRHYIGLAVDFTANLPEGYTTSQFMKDMVLNIQKLEPEAKFSEGTNTWELLNEGDHYHLGIPYSSNSWMYKLQDKYSLIDSLEYKAFIMSQSFKSFYDRCIGIPLKKLLF